MRYLVPGAGALGGYFGGMLLKGGAGLFSQPDSTYGPSMLIDIEDGRPTERAHDR
jgi:ketopantoate reductase